METKYFKSIINKSSSEVVMLYWAAWGNILIEKRVNIKPNQEVLIPVDNALDQFKILTFDYTIDLFKFSHKFNSVLKKRIFVHEDNIDVQDNEGVITFSKK